MGYCLSMDIGARKARASRTSTRFDAQVASTMEEIDSKVLNALRNIALPGILEELNRAFLASLDHDNELAWDFQINSSLGMQQRPLLSIRMDAMHRTVSPVASKSPHRSACPACLGLGYNAPIHFPGRAKKSIPDMSIVVESERNVKSRIPESALRAEMTIHKLLDRARGEGRFDEVLREAEKAMVSLGKEPESYEVTVLSRFYLRGMLASGSRVYRLSLAPAKVIRQEDGTDKWLSSEFEFENAGYKLDERVVAHFKPCMICEGTGQSKELVLK